MQGTSCNTALAAASAANLTGTQWWMLTNFYEIFIYLPTFIILHPSCACKEYSAKNKKNITKYKKTSRNPCVSRIYCDLICLLTCTHMKWFRPGCSYPNKKIQHLEKSMSAARICYIGFNHGANVFPLSAPTWSLCHRSGRQHVPPSRQFDQSGPRDGGMGWCLTMRNQTPGEAGVLTWWLTLGHFLKWGKVRGSVAIKCRDLRCI